MSNTTNEKHCKRCEATKSIDCFKPNTKGHYAYCIPCTKSYRSEYGKNNRERLREVNKRWKENNIERVRELARNWHRANNEKSKQSNRESYQKHKDERQKAHSEHYINNKESYQVRRRKNAKLRSKIPKYKIINSLRRGINMAVKGTKKYARTLDLLGCSVDEFKKKLESKFKKGMSWDNYGTVWHIDHIVPVSSFDMEMEESQRICFHYSNMQPLFAQENMKKRDKILIPIQIQIPLCA